MLFLFVLVFVFSPVAVVPVQLSVTAMGEWMGGRACDASWVALSTPVLIVFSLFFSRLVYNLHVLFFKSMYRVGHQLSLLIHGPVAYPARGWQATQIHFLNKNPN